MDDKIPEEFSYEYLILLGREELASYYTDAVPPQVGTLLDPWEFVVDEEKRKKKLQFQGPFRVMEVLQQPKNMDGREEVSSQALVQVIVKKVEKASETNFELPPDTQIGSSDGH